MIGVVCFFALMYSPESPRCVPTLPPVPRIDPRHRWLCEAGRYEEAHSVLERLYGQQYADVSIDEIREAINIERAAASQHKGLSACFRANEQCVRPLCPFERAAFDAHRAVPLPHHALDRRQRLPAVHRHQHVSHSAICAASPLK